MSSNAIMVALCTLFASVVWFDTEIAEPLRRKVQSTLANMGWREEGDDGEVAIVVREGWWRPIARWLYSLVSCPLCLGVHIAFWVTVYLIGDVWSKPFWLTFGAACGLFYLGVRSWQILGQRLGVL